MADIKNVLLGENPVHLVYLKRPEQGEKPVIIKRLNSPFPGDEQVAQLKNEYITTKNLNIPGMRKAIRFNEGEGNYQLELEYVDGISLEQLIQARNESIPTLVTIISKVCTILGQLHQAGWIHASLKTTNILVNPETLAPCIIDASLMTRFSLKASSRISAEKLRSILPYISPEQTGRTNRSLDHRSDLYSLGVTFYEIITGKKPFEGNDPLELIYSHLARIPAAPHVVNPAVPPILSAIIMKLLAKNAEDRYQSAYGLKFDLDRVLEHWQEISTLDFSLGEKDFSGKLQIPQKLYGRSGAIDTLLDNLELTITGGRKAVFISGESGTGKSAIVQEVRKPITENKGFYIQGKFDQFARNIPYSAWIEIFRDFVNQLLTAEEKEIQKWRNLLLHALGNSTGVLTDLIPNLKYIIHDIPPAEELGVTETQNRLNDLLNRFFKSIATEEHPITVFLDDLQWADNASLNLLKTLLTDPDNKYLLLLCAYRNDELKESDTLAVKIDEIEHSGLETVKIELGNLSFENIHELITDTLRTDPASTYELARVVYSKTQGNPYFTDQFIYTLSEENLIRFNWERSIESRKPVWEWELSAIHAKLISNNVVELLVGQIRELPVTVIETLKSAACIGNTFKLNTLSTVRKQDIGVIADLLDEAINEGYVFYKNVNQIHWVREGMDVEFQFSHDRVQQALYSLIPDEEKQQTHYEIGKLLYASLQPAQVEEQIFQLVFHLNFGIDIITDAASKLWLAQLNLKAGKEAKKIIAYESAYVYLSIASKLCGEQIWKTEPDFALKLGSELLDSTYLSNRFDEAEKYFIFLIDHITDPVKKAELYYRKMIQYQHLSKIDNILDTGLEGLALLGMEFSPRTGRMKVLSELMKTSLMLRGKTDEDLLNMPEVSDPKIRIAMSLIYKTMVFAYDRSENLMAILGMNLLQLSVQYGNYKDSLAGYSTYAGILSIAFNNYKQAGRLNSVALKVADKVADKPAHAMAYFGAGMTTYTPFRQSYFYFKKSFDTAVEGGAHTDAAPSTMYFYFLSFIQGKRLSEVHQILLDNLYFTDQIKTENFHLILLAGVNCVHELKEGLETPATGLRGKKLDAQELEQKIQNTEHRSIRIYARIFQMYNHMTFGHYDKALKCEKEVMDGLNVTLGTVIGPYFHYLRGILYSRLLQQQGMVTRKEARSVIAGSLKRIHKFNLTCTDNFQVWEWMLKAELVRIDQKKEEAQEAYNNAIEIARTASNLADVALGSFQCALFHEQNGNKKIAEFYYQESVSGYKAWGADAVAQSITVARKGVTGTSQMVGAVPLMDIDQESLIRLSQLISSEIDYHRLIKKLMTVFVENAGAEKAFLIMNTNGEWFIEAEQRKNEEVIMERHLLFDPAAPEGSNHAVPISVCQYVIRTGETVIIENATSDERFSKSTYIKTNHPKSIICMPLIKKGELTGLVYLENNLMSGAFKTDRIQLLNYISSQIAVLP